MHLKVEGTAKVTYRLIFRLLKEIKAFKCHLGSKIYGHGDASCVEQGEIIGLLDFVQLR